MEYTNKGLVEYAKAMLDYHSPYWYGTFGQIASESLYLEKLRQYPSQYNKWSKSSFTEQYGKKVHDCAGLIKGYLMTPEGSGYPFNPAVYNSKYDFSANGLEALAKEKGPISGIPEIEGIIVWKSGHVGIYIGNGWVIEERGHTYGTVKTRLADREWKEWLKCPYITYSSTPSPAPTPAVDYCKIDLPILRKGMEGGSVINLQYLLIAKGYKDKNGDDLKPDNKFGSKTQYAVICFQQDTYPDCAEPDGVVGTKTWTKLLRS